MPAPKPGGIRFYLVYATRCFGTKHMHTWHPVTGQCTFCIKAKAGTPCDPSSGILEACSSCFSRLEILPLARGRTATYSYSSNSDYQNQEPCQRNPDSDHHNCCEKVVLGHLAGGSSSRREYHEEHASRLPDEGSHGVSAFALVQKVHCPIT